MPLIKFKVKAHWQHRKSGKVVRIPAHETTREFKNIRGPYKRKTNRPYRKTSIEISSMKNYSSYHKEYYRKYLKRSNKS